MNAPQKIQALSVTPPRVSSDAQAVAAAANLAEIFNQAAVERDRNRRLPYPEIEQFSQTGLGGMTVPKDYGGADVSALTVAEVTAILASADGSLGQIPQNHFYLVEAVRLNGTDAQRRFYFERALLGDRFANALAEAGGKYATDQTTTVLPDGDDYVLNGRKFYCSGSLFGHWIVAAAQNDQNKRVLVFVPRDTQGLTVIDDWSGMGQRTTGSGTVIFDNVRVSAFAIIPHYLAFEQPTQMGAFAQIIHAAIDLGIARGAFAATVDFVRTKARPWVDSGQEHAYEDPYTIAAIGDLRVRIAAAEALVRRAGKIIDKARVEPETYSEPASIAVAEARVATNDVSLLVTSKLFELGGSRSALASLDLDRYWRDARTHTLHDPVRWKYFSLGNYWLNGVKPPRRGNF
ncbi:SfnB family sulfur acquisition oxidoreductase [Beijerinckia indica]|uniref:Dibenzothiophene monooxygenase n=1 Tax=Beijerinckia indica subsp. indica (strain ATCC 9039 / DSM 1715 / NCIMB 8712) TaxID=395963 RepID=B2IFB0_BEII9|nr:SfnB family sulfur acquisition oxidoreductase [Beijerinckia indica]ACB95675.1 Acyl-CoA dehydrogenase type 2 domain [Beijerinckia indica subsp. indica ATCC 9039]